MFGGFSRVFFIIEAYTYRGLGGAEAIGGRWRGPGTDCLPVKGCSYASKGSRGWEVRIDDLRIVPLVLIVVIALVLVSKHVFKKNRKERRRFHPMISSNIYVFRNIFTNH